MALKLFGEISDIPRPSSGENLIRNYIVARARQVWVGYSGFEILQDAIGNLLVRIPGTGQFENSEDSIGLQGHLDMVTKVHDSVTNLTKHFEAGIPFELRDGKIQSAGNVSTLGADNGLALMTMLRYIVDRTIEHPPQELIFTVREETDFAGVLNFDLPLKSSVILNLDFDKTGEVCAGCAGGVLFNLEQTQTAEKIPDSVKIYEMTLTGLRGGHSGIDIHRPRLHANEVGARLLHDTSLDVGLISFESGKSKGEIPDSFTLRFAVSKQMAGEIERRARTKLVELVGGAADEDLTQIVLRVQELDRSSAQQMISMEDSRKILQTIIRFPKGILRRLPQTGLPNDILVSINLGILMVNTTHGLQMTQIFLRGHDLAAMKEGVAAIRAHHFNFDYTELGAAEPWVAKDDTLTAVVQQVALAHFGERWRMTQIHGGLETRIFALKFSGAMHKSLAPAALYDTHSVSEALICSRFLVFFPSWIACS